MFKPRIKKNMIIRYLGHNWIIANEPSTLGKKYVLLKRKAYYSDLQRYGQVVTAIDASKKDIERLAYINL